MSSHTTAAGVLDGSGGNRDAAVSDTQPAEVGLIRVFHDAQDSIVAATGIVGTHAIVRFDAAASADGDAFMFSGQPPLIQAPFDIKAALDPSDRSLWFTDKGANRILSITSS